MKTPIEPRSCKLAGKISLALLCTMSLVAGCSRDGNPTLPAEDLRVKFNLQTLPAIPYPPDNQPRQERIALGRLLFFDPILSGEKDVACGACHHPFYNDGAKPRHPAVTDAGLDPSLRQPLGLTEAEISAVVEFMKALTDPGTALDPMLLTVPQQVPSGLRPVFGVRGPGSGFASR